MDRLRALVAGILLVVMAGGCDRSGGDSRDREGTGAATTTPAASGSTSTGGSPSTTPTAPADEEIAVVLGTGRLVVGGNALVFDAPEFQVSAYLERALGDPTDEQDAECGPGRLHLLAWPGLDVFLLDDRLVGWLVDEGRRATDRGIRLGSTTAELTAAYPSVTFPESTLGEEFFVEASGQEAAGLSGLLEEGRVAALWSGATCVAR